MRYARASLFGVPAQYNLVAAVRGHGRAAARRPAEGLDSWQEASSRWDWTRAKLEGPALESLIAAAGGAP